MIEDCIIKPLSLMWDMNTLVILCVGGKSSGIFGDPEPQAQPQRSMPPGGLSSNIFGATESAPAESPSRSHPNKPKVSNLPNYRFHS